MAGLRRKAAANRYSALNQINTSNVNQLQVAWTYRTGDNLSAERHRNAKPADYG